MSGGLPPKTSFDLFDKMVVPVLCYGAEVWGFEKRERIERVHLKFCKYVLGVSAQTTSVAVYGECGRYPLFVVYYCKCIKFWLKITQMSCDRLTNQCYRLSKQLSGSGRNTWRTKVKSLLCRYGLQYVWEAQVLEIIIYLSICLNKECRIVLYKIGIAI